MDSTVLKKRIKSQFKTVVSIGDKKLVSFRYKNGIPYVNIRSYKRDKHGRMFATKRGIMLSLEEWKSLKEDTNEIDMLGVKSSNLLTRIHKTDEGTVLCEGFPAENSKFASSVTAPASQHTVKFNEKRKTGSLTDVKLKSPVKKRKKKIGTELV